MGNLRRRLLTALAGSVALTGLALASAPAASAHPLGNFTVNYYSGIRVEPHAVEVALVVDRAEIPTLQAFPDAAAGRQPAGAGAWRASQCALLARQATLAINGTRVPLKVTGSRLELLPGAAGLATSRLECTVRTGSPVDVVGHLVTYQAATTLGRVGWHEVTARGNGTTISVSDVPTSSISKQLTQYPQDLLTSPLDQRTARFEVRAGSGLVTTQTASGTLLSSPLRGLDRFTSAYTNLVSRTTLTPSFALLAIALSVLLGGLHAFAPGHGKTLMAAYLVGREGTLRQAAVIGLSVTVTHTVGVLLLGVALSAAALAAPERVYPWLGLLSGVLLAGIGVTLLRSARAGHTHGPGGHTHGPGDHTHGPGGHTHGDSGHTHGDSEHTHGLEEHTQSAGTPAHSADKYRAGATPLVSALAGASPVQDRQSTTTFSQAHGGVGVEPVREQGYASGHGHPHADGHDHGHEHDIELGHEHEHDHDHDHDHDQHHHENNHGHDHGHHDGHDHQNGRGAEQQTQAPRRIRSGNWRLAAVGLAGGLVPSPSALLVLLGGIALGRAWFGALLVLFYGVGMATALVGTGLLLVLARDRFERWSTRRSERRPLPGQDVALRLARAVPVLTAVAVIGVGAWVAIRSLMTI